MLGDGTRKIILGLCLLHYAAKHVKVFSSYRTPRTAHKLELHMHKLKFSARPSETGAHTVCPCAHFISSQAQHNDRTYHFCIAKSPPNCGQHSHSTAIQETLCDLRPTADSSHFRSTRLYRVAQPQSSDYVDPPSGCSVSYGSAATHLYMRSFRSYIHT